MMSQKVRQILIAKGAPFTSEEMDTMTDTEGWAWIYKTHPPKTKKNAKKLPEICFTGFDPYRKEELKKIAEDHGFHCVTSITKNLSYLCIGEAPGPSKLKEATERGVSIVSENAFIKKINLPPG
jgi:NAD-dependent DNA ligase